MRTEGRNWFAQSLLLKFRADINRLHIPKPRPASLVPSLALARSRRMLLLAILRRHFVPSIGKQPTPNHLGVSPPGLPVVRFVDADRLPHANFASKQKAGFVGRGVTTDGFVTLVCVRSI